MPSGPGPSAPEIQANQPPLAEGVDKDPRIAALKKELSDDWEKVHGSRWEGDNMGRWQDYIYGDPTARRSGGKPVTIEDRATDLFRERFPEDAKAYEKIEQVRVYEEPERDPAIQQIEENIARITNTDPEVKDTTTALGYNEAWDRAYNRTSINLWHRFVGLYPEKAAAYKGKVPGIDREFEGQERLRQYKEGQQRLEEGRPKNIGTEPTYREFMDDPKNGLNARIWAEVSGEQSLTGAQYSERARVIKAQMEQEFAGAYPDIWMRFYPNNQLDSPISPTQPTEVAKEINQFDPAVLLEGHEIGIDEFFKLDPNQLIERFSSLESLPDNTPMKQKALYLIELLQTGKEAYLKANPGTLSVHI